MKQTLTRTTFKYAVLVLITMFLTAGCNTVPTGSSSAKMEGNGSDSDALEMARVEASEAKAIAAEARAIAEQANLAAEANSERLDRLYQRLLQK